MHACTQARTRLLLEARVGGSYTLKLRRTGTDRCTGTRIPSRIVRHVPVHLSLHGTESFPRYWWKTGMPTLYANRTIVCTIGSVKSCVYFTYYVCVDLVTREDRKGIGLDWSVRGNNLRESDRIFHLFFFLVRYRYRYFVR